MQLQTIDKFVRLLRWWWCFGRFRSVIQFKDHQDGNSEEYKCHLVGGIEWQKAKNRRGTHQQLSAYLPISSPCSSVIHLSQRSLYSRPPIESISIECLTRVWGNRLTSISMSIFFSSALGSVNRLSTSIWLLRDDGCSKYMLVAYYRRTRVLISDFIFYFSTQSSKRSLKCSRITYLAQTYFIPCFRQRCAK